MPDTWKKFHREVNRIKSLLNNKNFPTKLVGKKVNKFVSFKDKHVNNEVKNKTNSYF